VTDTFPRPSKEGIKLPQIVEDVIMKAVAKDPEERYSEMSEFAQALEQLALGEKADTRRIRRLLRQKKKRPAKGKLSTRRLALATGLGTLLVLLVLIGAGWLLRTRLPNSPAWQLVSRNLPAALALPTQTAPAETTQARPPTAPPTATATLRAPTQTPAPTSAPEAIAATEAPIPTKQPAATFSNLPLAGTAVPFPSTDLLNGTVSKIGLWGIGGVNAVVFSPDGKRIALGTSDAIFVYDASTFERLQFIETNEWVETIIFDAEGQTILAGLRNGQVTGWDTTSLQPVIEIAYTRPNSERISGDTSAPVKALAFSSNERYLAIGYQNGAISIWSVGKESSKPEHIWDQPHTISGLAFSADSRYLYVASDKNEINIWDISIDRNTKKVPVTSPITSMILSRDGSLLVGGGEGGIVHLIDATKQTPVYSFLSLGAPVTSLALSGGNEQVAIGLKNGKVKVFRVPGKEELSRVHKEQYVLEGHPDAVTSLAFSPDGQVLASSSWKEGLKTWEAASGAGAKSLALSQPDIQRMVFSPDSQWLMVSSVDGLTQAWQVHDGAVRYEFEGTLPRGTPFSADGKYLVIARDAPTRWGDGWLDIIDLPNGKVIKTLKGYQTGWLVSFSPDGNILVSGDTKNANIWDTSTWEKVRKHGGSKDSCSEFLTLDNQRLSIIWGEAIMFKYDPRVESLCATRPVFASPLFLPTDLKYAIYLTEKGKFWSYNMDPNQIQSAQVTDFYRKKDQAPDDLLAVSADNNLIAFATQNSKVTLTRANWAYLYNSGRNPCLTLTRQADFQYKAAISPDNKIFAAGSRFGTISLWAVP
jgi:WD40 repeat protein